MYARRLLVNWSEMASEPTTRIENPAFDAWMTEQGGALLNEAIKNINVTPPAWHTTRKMLAILLKLSWIQAELAKPKPKG